MFKFAICLIISFFLQSGEISQKKLNLKLIQLVQNGNLATIKNILDQGADLNCANKLGDRPLTLAIENQNLGVLNELLRRGADVNALNGNLRTPLMVAMECQDLRRKTSKQIFESILDHCPNLAIEDLDGNTALSDAVEAHSCYYLQQILKRFAPEHLAAIKNKNGHNLTDLVLQEHDSRKTKLLCDYQPFKNQVARKLISKISNIASQDGQLSAEVISTLVHGLNEFPELVKERKKPRLEHEYNYFI
jgi:ankyrin repeat protein